MRATKKCDRVRRVLVPLDGRQGLCFAVRNAARLASDRRVPLAFVLFASDGETASRASRAISDALRGAAKQGVEARLVVDGSGDYARLGLQVEQDDLVLLAQDVDTASAMQPHTSRAGHLLFLSESTARS